MKKGILIGIVFIGSILLFSWQDAGAKEYKPLIDKKCSLCHEDYESETNILACDLEGHSRKAGLILVGMTIGSKREMRLVRYEKDVRVDNLQGGIKDLEGHLHLLINYKKVGADLVATRIVVKTEVYMPDDDLISTKELEKLVSMGPEKGNYTLAASHGKATYDELHIPTAISLPVFKTEKLKHKLPKDKEQLLILYCDGYR
jgi:hypothetical protein